MENEERNIDPKIKKTLVSASAGFDVITGHPLGLRSGIEHNLEFAHNRGLNPGSKRHKESDKKVNSSGNLLPVGSKTHTLIDKSNISEVELRKIAGKNYKKMLNIKVIFKEKNKKKAYF